MILFMFTYIGLHCFKKVAVFILITVNFVQNFIKIFLERVVFDDYYFFPSCGRAVADDDLT